MSGIRSRSAGIEIEVRLQPLGEPLVANAQQRGVALEQDDGVARRR